MQLFIKTALLVFVALALVALSFCPVSAALFFGSLLPVAPRPSNT